MNQNDFPPGFVPAGPSTTNMGAALNIAQEAAQQQQQAAPPQQPDPEPTVNPGQVAQPQQVVAPEVKPVDTKQAQAATQTTPADLDDTIIQRALGVASGGKVNSVSDLQALFEAQSQKALLDAKVADLEAKSQINPFVSPVAQKVNELYAKGATTAEVEHFIRIQNLDVANMDQLSAVRLSVQSENPDFDAAMVDAYMANNLGLSNFIEGDPSDITASDKVKMAMAHREAVAKINALKVSSETPASVSAKANEAQVAAQRLQTYQNVAQTVSNASKTVAFDLGDTGKFEFNVPAEFSEAATRQLAEMGAQGQWTLDDSGVRNAQQIFKSMVGAAYLDQIITSATKHAEAKTREAVLREMSGPAPSVGNKLPGTQAPAPKQSNGGWSENAPDPSHFLRNW